MNKQFARITLVGVLVLMGASRVASAQISPIPNAADPNADNGEDVPLKFKGLTLNVTLQDATALNAYNYSNQLYTMIEPSWALGKFALPKSKLFHRMTVAVRIPITYSLTGYDPVAAGSADQGPIGSCSDAQLGANGSLNAESVKRCSVGQSYRPTPGDISLFIANPGMYTIPKAQIRLSPSIRFNFPVSYESRYTSMIMSAQAAVGFGRTFLDHKLSASYQLGAAKVFNRYTAATAEASGSGVNLGNGYIGGASAQDVQANSDAFYSSGSRLASPGGLNTSFSFSNIFNVGYNFTEKFGVSAMYLISSAFAYDSGASCAGNYGGVFTDPCQNANTVANSQEGYDGRGTETRAIRNNQYFMLNASYQLKNWVGVYASWATFAPLRKPDNSWRQPFVSVDYNAFTSVNVGATFTVGYIP